MKIGILSRGPKLYSTRRLKETAVKRGHSVRVLDTLNFSLLVEEEQPQLFYAHKLIQRFDAIIPRVGPSITFYGTAVVRQFEQMGVFTLASSQAITVSRDKLRSLQILSRHDIGLPASAFVRRKEDVLPAIEAVGGAPVIIKLLEGTQGVGVILADSIKIAEAIIETLQSARQNVLIQKFVAESRGKDIRAFVVGHRVVAAMRRTAQGQEFRSNVHRGGTTLAVELDEQYERTAVMAAQIMGLHVAGVDMLEGENGPQVMEVNSSPGLEGIENATDIDVADEIIRYMETQSQFPDIDVKQRLSLAKGYGVAEFAIPIKSELANKTLAESHLSDREIRVLSITRRGLVIPAPHGSDTLMPGDVVLCYGKQITLRSLLPPMPQSKKKKRKKVSSAS